MLSFDLATERTAIKAAPASESLTRTRYTEQAGINDNRLQGRSANSGQAALRCLSVMESTESAREGIAKNLKQRATRFQLHSTIVTADTQKVKDYQNVAE